MKNTGNKKPETLDIPTTRDGKAFVVGEIYYGVKGRIGECCREYEDDARVATIQPALCVSVERTRSGYEVRLKGPDGRLATLEWNGHACPETLVYASDTEAVSGAAATFTEDGGMRRMSELDDEIVRFQKLAKRFKAKIRTLEKCIATNGKSQVSTDGVRQQVAQLRKMAKAGGAQ